MPFDIGAGTKIYIGTASAPNNTAHGGTAADADLTDISAYIKSFNISNAQATVDVTTLNAASNGYFRSFITGLINGTVSLEYIDDALGTIFKRLLALQTNTVSAVSRGMFDVIIKVGGATTGNLKLSFTMSLTSLPLTGAVEAAYGGSGSGQISGAITASAQ